MGSAVSSYARWRTASGTKRCLGVAAKARETHHTCRGCCLSLLLPSEIPLSDDLEQLVVRQVHVQWRDGDVAVLQCLEVGVGASGPRHPPAADPVNLAAPGVLHRRDLFVKDPAAEVRDLHALHLIPRNGRQVDVEQRFAGEILDADDALDQALESPAMTLEML